MERANLGPARRVLLSLCVGLAIAAGAHSVAAADPPEIGSSEVYYDLKTGRFGARFAAGAAKEHTLVMLDDPNAEISVYYWRLDSPTARRARMTSRGHAFTPAKAATTCESSAEYAAIQAGQPLPAGVTVRAAARVGAEAGGQQKYTTRVGPLYVNRQYCFTATRVFKRPLSEEQQKQVDTALAGAIDQQLTRAYQLASPEELSCTDEAESSPAGSDDSKLSAAHAEISVAKISKAFQKNLQDKGWTEKLLQVVEPETGETISFAQVFERIAGKDPAFREGLIKRVDALMNQRGFPRQLKALICTIPEFGSTTAYDPLSGLDPKKVARKRGAPVTFAELIKDEKDRESVAKVLDDKAKFVAELWRLRTRLIDHKDRAELEPSLERLLMDFLKQPEDLFVGYAKIEPDERNELVRALTKAAEAAPPQTKDIIKLTGGMVTRFRPKDDEFAWCARSLPACPHGFVAYDANRAALDQLEPLVQSLERLQHAAEAHDKDPDAFEPEPVEKLPGYSSLRKGLRSVQRRTTATATAAKRADFAEGIPLYATADVGFLTPFYDGGAPDDLLAYFGVSFYFAAVDKDERLHGWDFWRRFSLVGGMTLGGPSTGGEQGLGGTIGANAGLAGAGLRLTDYLRFSGGALFLTQQPQLSVDKQLRVAPYLGLSVDIDVAAQIRAWQDKVPSD